MSITRYKIRELEYQLQAAYRKIHTLELSMQVFEPYIKDLPQMLETLHASTLFNEASSHYGQLLSVGNTDSTEATPSGAPEGLVAQGTQTENSAYP